MPALITCFDLCSFISTMHDVIKIEILVISCTCACMHTSMPKDHWYWLVPLQIGMCPVYTTCYLIFNGSTQRNFLSDCPLLSDNIIGAHWNLSYLIEVQPSAHFLYLVGLGCIVVVHLVDFMHA